MPLKLEELKLYRTRGGYKVLVKKLEKDKNYPVLAEVVVAAGGNPMAVYYTLEGRAGTFSFYYDIEGEWTGWT